MAKPPVSMSTVLTPSSDYLVMGRGYSLMRQLALVFLSLAMSVLAIGCGDDIPNPPPIESHEDDAEAPRSTSKRRRRTEAGADYPPEITNSIAMSLRLLPAGGFMMGSGVPPEMAARTSSAYDAKAAWFEDEYPRHAVRISKPFYLGVEEVTVGQFRRFVDATGYETEAERSGGGYGWNAGEDVFDNGDYTWRTPGFPQEDDHPVLVISWNDAIAFCRWLTEKEGVGYRLPTEAEWEYACRAGTTTRYYHGDDVEGLTEVGNMVASAPSPEEPGEYYPAFSVAVASLRPNAFGLYDMHGNAWEWCADWYAKDYYARSPATDPKGPETGESHVIRGGSFLSGFDDTRTANRDWDPTNLRLHHLGFRVARDQ